VHLRTTFIYAVATSTSFCHTEVLCQMAKPIIKQDGRPELQFFLHQMMQIAYVKF